MWVFCVARARNSALGRCYDMLLQNFECLVLALSDCLIYFSLGNAAAQLPTALLRRSTQSEQVCLRALKSLLTVLGERWSRLTGCACASRSSFACDSGRAGKLWAGD